MEGLKKIINSKSKTFLAFCFSFILGVVVASGFELQKSILFYAFILIWGLLFLLMVFWKSFVLLPPRPSVTPPSKGGGKHSHRCYYFRFIIFTLLFFTFGIIRVLLFLPDIDKNHIAFYDGETKEFIAKVIKEPDVRIGKAYYILDSIEHVEELSPPYEGGEDLRSRLGVVNGRVKITTQLYPEFKYGDVLKIKCKLQKPENKEDSKFKYDKFLALEKVYSVCYYPAITNLHFEESENFYKIIFKFKSKIANRINFLWSEPESSFMAGLLYGYRGGFPKTLQENFNKTGLTHIVAISGFNISIISIFLMLSLIYLGVYRKQAFWITILGIFLFVVFVGSSASVVRAGVMGSLVLLANYFGRPSKVFNVLILTLVLMLIINPLSLLFDVGFQLSFVAVLGLVYLSPIIEDIFKRKLDLKHVFFDVVIKLLSATLSAIIITLPLILYFFERFSTVALVTNVLILWIIPWLMLFGFLSLILSFIFLPIGLVLAWVVNIGLKYVIIIVNWFGNKSWSSIEFTMPFYFVLISYGILIWWYKNNNKK